MRVRWRTIVAAGFGLLFAVSMSSAAQKVHLVAAGQTPAGIAHRYGISVADLCAMNQLQTGTRLHIGQKLLIPEPGEVSRMQQRKRLAKSSQNPGSPAEPGSVASSAPTTVAVQADPSVLSSDAVQAPDHVEQVESVTTNGEDTAATTPKSEDSVSTTPKSAARASVESRPSAGLAPERHVKANSERQTHVVAQGNTIGKIAHRYHVHEESILRANGLRRADHLKLGQTLVIPSSDDDPIITTGPQFDTMSGIKKSPHEGEKNGMSELEVSGAGPVYYYEPTGPGRNAMRPLLVYLHGRGGDAEQDCRRWAPVARRFGWLVCPSGPVAHNSGRTWNNSWPAGQHAVMGAIRVLRERYGRRIQLFGNTLIGFSEGAFVAMNVGVREPKTFNRWLILGADTSYWGGSGLEALQEARGRVRRVVLITGGRDQVVDDTRKVAEWLSRARVPIKIQTPDNLAHEVALDRMPGLYENALRWLDKGGQPHAAAQR
jgi:LysM repeat protein/predicted esterase